MPDEFTGGLGAKGAQALRDFARAGGTLIFLNGAAEYGIEKLGINAKNVVAGLPAQEFYSPGSLLNVRLNLRDPLTRGSAGSDRDLVGIESGVGDGRGSGGAISGERNPGVGLAARRETHRRRGRTDSRTLR